MKMNSGMALRVNSVSTFHTASMANDVAPLAKTWRITRPVRPSAAPNGAPVPIVARIDPVSVSQNMGRGQPCSPMPSSGRPACRAEMVAGRPVNTRTIW